MTLRPGKVFCLPEVIQELKTKIPRVGEIVEKRFPGCLIDWQPEQSMEQYAIRELVWDDPSQCPELSTASHLYLITGVDSTFRKAMKHINDSSLVGVSMETEGLGRFGRLCLVTLSTKKCVFVFDILTLGQTAFTYGLADLFENEKIMKVFHDARLESDMLRHIYGISLKNIFDTVMADLIFLSQYVYDGSIPLHPR